MFFERLSYTWELMRASGSVLKRDKALVLFPLFSGIACLLVLASFIAPLFVADTHWLRASFEHPSQQQKVLAWVYLFAFYFVNYFVITFFNVAIVACAVSRLAGGEPTFGGGLREAFSRIHLIAGWALLSATVGLLLKLIETQNKKVGHLIASVLGAAWTIMTFLAVPVLVVENKGPIASLKESASLLRKTWGTQVVGNFSFGLIFFLLFLPGIFLFVLAATVMAKAGAMLGLMVLGLAIAYIVILALIQSALHSIFQAAVYTYTQGVTDATHAFPVKLLRDAMYNRA